MVLASGNPGKLRELSKLLEEQHIEILPLAEFTDEAAEETGQSFVENAILKARFAAACSGLPALADDSGLVVAALDGAPGLYSARYARVNATDQENLQKLLQALNGVPRAQRGAHFFCAVAVVRSQEDAVPLIAQGRWDGSILNAPVGNNGFGYDPVFYVPGENCSAAELSAERKNALSHRGKALRQLVAHLAEGSG